MIYLKVHDGEEGIVIALCDENLIDKVFEEGELYINIRDYNEFYVGNLIDPNDYKLGFNVDDISSINAIGDESVTYLIKNNLVAEGNIKKVEGVPYAHSYVIKDKK